MWKVWVLDWCMQRPMGVYGMQSVPLLGPAQTVICPVLVIAPALAAYWVSQDSLLPCASPCGGSTRWVLIQHLEDAHMVHR